MALARLSLLKRSLYSPPFRLSLVDVCRQYRLISHSRFLSEGPKETESLGSGESQNVASEVTESTPGEALNVTSGEARLVTRPYSEALRESLMAKYYGNQPVAKPHSLTKEYISKKEMSLSLAELRLRYARRVSSLRKKYAREVEEQRKAKARQDRIKRREIRMAKEERLKTKKEKSAQRALEVETERQIFQARLAKERAEKAMHRHEKEKKLEEKRQKERDIIRQQSANWIEEKDLEERIIEAVVNPIEL